MRELYFEEFISFAALFFIYEHLRGPVRGGLNNP